MTEPRPTSARSGAPPEGPSFTGLLSWTPGCTGRGAAREAAPSGGPEALRSGPREGAARLLGSPPLTHRCLLSLPSSHSRLCRSAHWLLSPPPSRLGRRRPDSPARLGTAPHTFPLGPSSTNKRAKPEAGTHGKGHGFEPKSEGSFLCLSHLPVTASNLSGKASSVKKSALFSPIYWHLLYTGH